MDVRQTMIVAGAQKRILLNWFTDPPCLGVGSIARGQNRQAVPECGVLVQRRWRFQAGPGEGSPAVTAWV